MKQVIHFKIPTDDYGNAIIRYDELKLFAEQIYNVLKDDCNVLFTPFTMQTKDNNGNFINVEIPEVGLEELLDKYLKKIT